MDISGPCQFTAVARTGKVMLADSKSCLQGPPLSAAVAADKTQDTVKSGFKSTFGMS